MIVDERRVRLLGGGKHERGSVLYIMGRDFRVQDNWGLLYAQQKALEYKVPLGVMVHMGKNFIETNERQHSFLVDGLEEVSRDLEELKIPFFITYGDIESEVKTFIKIHDVGMIVTDFSPLHELRWWWNSSIPAFIIPIYEVDAHNTVPCWLLSDKEEYAAHTFRPKHKQLFDTFESVIPEVISHPYSWDISVDPCWPYRSDTEGSSVVDWNGVRSLRSFESHVPPVLGCRGGAIAAHKNLKSFLEDRLKHYKSKYESPTEYVLSDLLPYIKYGFISTQHIAQKVQESSCSEESKKAFLEELIIRKELSENFCFYNSDYYNYRGIPKWANKTLNEHRDDPREYIYTFEQFENGKTHDELWNAAQIQLVKLGKMYSYMRMYWAKKILEWTNSPEEALEIAVRLNDRYSLDGHDPNAYARVLRSVGGLHDRAWYERKVTGKIRYMNYNGCKRRFDVDAYIKHVQAL